MLATDLNLFSSWDVSLEGLWPPNLYVPGVTVVVRDYLVSGLAQSNADNENKGRGASRRSGLQGSLHSALCLPGGSRAGISVSVIFCHVRPGCRQHTLG